MATSIGMGGGGAPGFKFTTIGDTIEGDITDLEEAQIIDPDTNEPQYWPGGQPKMQIIVTLQTDYTAGEGIDPEKYSGEDDGVRRIWIKGHLYTATREAVKTAGCKSIDVGGVIKVRFDSIGEKKKVTHSPPKLYKVRYTAPPAASVSMADDGDDF